MNGRIIEERISTFRLDNPFDSGSVDGVEMYIDFSSTVSLHLRDHLWDTWCIIHCCLSNNWEPDIGHCLMTKPLTQYAYIICCFTLSKVISTSSSKRLTQDQIQYPVQ